MIIRHLFFIALTCLLSCKAQKDGHTLVGEPMEDMVLLDHDSFTNIDSFEARVIRDAKSLNKFYREINKTRKPGLPVPMVDFSKDMLVLICLGEQKGEKTPILSQLKESDEEILIALEVVEEEKSGEIMVQPIYYPFYLYKLPLVDKPFTFQKVDK
ncbi:hypothetical protein PY092_14780 [Muricauda sp. 334s03]|uniref:Uncharacterized protein n=1 Tax=Flagellimonas yonaguniensis TaxID=3031325 RepID=A0ABT5Y1V3_9FLAO|nr:hypothetical protein [[Muricauda] yonaguniensis]MDF0717427.1 hypothetical protein [[Muricauda] yonaguniensis]